MRNFHLLLVCFPEENKSGPQRPPAPVVFEPLCPELAATHVRLPFFVHLFPVFFCCCTLTWYAFSLFLWPFFVYIVYLVVYYIWHYMIFYFCLGLYFHAPLLFIMPGILFDVCSCAFLFVAWYIACVYGTGTWYDIH